MASVLNLVVFALPDVGSLFGPVRLGEKFIVVLVQTEAHFCKHFPPLFPQLLYSESLLRIDK